MFQVAMLVVALGAIALWPPERGAMLLLSLSATQAASADTALDAGAAIVAPGPWPGSLVVLGSRSRLSSAAWHRGMIVTAAPSAVCGDAALSKDRS